MADYHQKIDLRKDLEKDTPVEFEVDQPLKRRSPKFSVLSPDSWTPGRLLLVMFIVGIVIAGAYYASLQ